MKLFDLPCEISSAHRAINRERLLLSSGPNHISFAKTYTPQITQITQISK